MLDFRLPASRNQLFTDGHACYPENLQWTIGDGQWHGLTRTGTAPPLTPLAEHQGTFYYLSTEVCTWWFADATCRNHGGHLVRLDSAAEGDFVHAAVQAQIPGTTYFIGLTDWARSNGDWVWSDGTPPVWTRWAPGEPNNSHGEYFATVYGNGLWNDVPFGNRYRYVMETGTPLPESGPDAVGCGSWDSCHLHLDALAAAQVTPHVERRVYWQRVFQVTLGAGATYNQAHSYTHGTSETTGMSLGWSIGISVDASWGFVSTQIETEFHQDFQHEVTVSSEETFTKTYEATAPEGKTMVLALWQLRERYVITDGSGAPWSDPGYLLDAPLPQLDQGLQQEYLQTILFDQE